MFSLSLECPSPSRHLTRQSQYDPLHIREPRGRHLLLLLMPHYVRAEDFWALVPAPPIPLPVPVDAPSFPALSITTRSFGLPFTTFTPLVSISFVVFNLASTLSLILTMLNRVAFPLPTRALGTFREEQRGFLKWVCIWGPTSHNGTSQPMFPRSIPVSPIMSQYWRPPHRSQYSPDLGSLSIGRLSSQSVRKVLDSLCERARPMFGAWPLCGPNTRTDIRPLFFLSQTHPVKGNYTVLCPAPPSDNILDSTAQHVYSLSEVAAYTRPLSFLFQPISPPLNLNCTQERCLLGACWKLVASRAAMVLIPSSLWVPITSVTRFHRVSLMRPPPQNKKGLWHYGSRHSGHSTCGCARSGGGGYCLPNSNRNSCC